MNKLFKFKRFYGGAFAVFVLSAGSLFLFWPFLLGKLPSMGGGSLFHYMYFKEMARFVYDLKMLPNWWPAYNSGYPINLTLDAFLNPVFIFILKYLSPFFANNIMIAAFFVANGLGLYALARTLNLSRTASLIAAVSYSFSGVVVRYVGITTIAALMPFLPLSFLCLLKIFEGRLRWFWIWFALMFYAWIGGWSEMIVYALTALGFFAIYLIFQKRNSENFSWRYPLIFFGAIPLSALILSPWFLSVLHFISYSERAGGTGDGAAYMPTTLAHFLYMFNPRISVLYGDLLPFFPLGNEPYLLFFGTLPLLLALSVLFIKNIKGNRYLPFFIGLAAGSILMTVSHSPLFWLFHRLPVLKWFGGYWKWSFVIVFSLAILAGYGFDNLRDFFQHRLSKRAIIALWSLFILAVFAAGFIALFDSRIKLSLASYGVARYQNVPDRIFSRPAAYYRQVITEMANSLVDNFSLKNKWILLSSFLWLIALLYLTLGKYELVPYQKWRKSAVIITLLGSALFWTDIFNGPPASYLKTEPETAKFLHSINPYTSRKLPLDSENSASFVPYRIFLYTPYQFLARLSKEYGIDTIYDSEKRRWFSREMMEYNIHAMFDFDAFRNTQTLALKRLMALYFTAMRQDVSIATSYKDTVSLDDYLKAFSDEKNMRLLGALNIRYILTPLMLKNESRPIFATLAANTNIPVYIYENKHFMPRWYFSEKVLWAEGNDAEILKTLDQVQDFKKTTVLEPLTLNDEALSTKSSPSDKIELQLYTAGNLRLKTKTENHRFLIFSESRFPDFWQATVNAKSAPIYTANYLYQAILVPPGENIVEFRYPKLMEQGAIALNKRIETLLKINQ
ncbi:MAG: hypothetical protein AAB474_00600 [Patescibacteria group bacterium]